MRRENSKQFEEAVQNAPIYESPAIEVLDIELGMNILANSTTTGNGADNFSDGDW